MGLFSLFRRKPYERPGFLLYGAAVAAARQPELYEGLGVPDTMRGRFEAICLFVGLVIRRCRADRTEQGQALGQAVFDAMFADMDLTLREMGVGDLSVGKKNRELWEAFHGRAEAYGAAIDGGDRAALAGAIARNIWPEGAPEGSAERLAAMATDGAAALAALPAAALLRGEARFLPAGAAA
jgi:cytochrome b pre-mRNA-processing protein 3